MADEKSALKGVWTIIVENHETGESYEHESGNLVVDLGRENILKELFGIAGGLDFLYLGVGNGSTAAAETQTALVSEITLASSPAGSLADRVNLTDTSGGAIDAGDIQSDATVSPYRKKIVLQGIYGTTDNNGTTFREFAVFSSDTFGAGTMLNRFVLGSDIAKTSAISVTVQITFRA